MGPITDLIGTRFGCAGLENAYTWPLGYIIVWVQVNGVQGYNEDQIGLVVLDLLNIAERIPIILGTPTISCIVNVMKEGEIDVLAMPWANARVAHLLSVCRATATMVSSETMEDSSPNGYDKVVITKNTETINAFSSWVIPVKLEKAYTGEHINIMTQALQTKDGSLPQGLTVQNAYTELRKGSMNAVVVVRNSTAYPQTLRKKALVARAVAAIIVPGPLLETRVQEREDGPQNPHTPKLAFRQRQGKLFEELNQSGLDSWHPELADAACQPLAEYHNVFSSEPVELSCTHSTEYIIMVTDDTPLRNDLGKSLHLWWKRFGTISERC